MKYSPRKKKKTPEKRTLSSWKDIADYLKVTVRTAQRWERKFDLPIRRLGKDQKFYIMADANEIDEWIKKSNRRLKARSMPLLKIVFLFIIFLGIATLINYFLFKHPSSKTPGLPFSFLARSDCIEVYDQDGHYLWSYQVNERLEQRPYLSSSSPFIFFDDLDADNKMDVLMAVHTKDNIADRLVRLDVQGRVIWEYRPGLACQYGHRTYSSDFDIKLLHLSDLNGDGKKEIIVDACHKINFPCRIVVLDPDGFTQGEYWNTGHIVTIKTVDLNHDNYQEILLGGVNNNYQRGCLIILDVREITGCSPPQANSDFFPAHYTPGTELFYILIPPDSLSKFLFIQDTVFSIDLFNDQTFSVCTNKSRVFYKFNFDLSPLDVFTGLEFKQINQNLIQEGKIKTSFQINREKLLKEILYWNGQEWISKPSPNLLQ